MKYTVKNMKSRKVTIHDNIGRLIPAVKSFDSETFRIQFLPHNNKEKWQQKPSYE